MKKALTFENNKIGTWVSYTAKSIMFHECLYELIDNSIGAIKPDSENRVFVSISGYELGNIKGDEILQLIVADCGTGINDGFESLLQTAKSNQDSIHNEHGLGFKHSVSNLSKIRSVKDPEHLPWRISTRNGDKVIQVGANKLSDLDGLIYSEFNDFPNNFILERLSISDKKRISTMVEVKFPIGFLLDFLLDKKYHLDYTNAKQKTEEKDLIEAINSYWKKELNRQDLIANAINELIGHRYIRVKNTKFITCFESTGGTDNPLYVNQYRTPLLDRAVESTTYKGDDKNKLIDPTIKKITIEIKDESTNEIIPVEVSIECGFSYVGQGDFGLTDSWYKTKNIFGEEEINKRIFYRNNEDTLGVNIIFGDVVIKTAEFRAFFSETHAGYNYFLGNISILSHDKEIKKYFPTTDCKNGFDLTSLGWKALREAIKLEVDYGKYRTNSARESEVELKFHKYLISATETANQGMDFEDYDSPWFYQPTKQERYDEWGKVKADITRLKRINKNKQVLEIYELKDTELKYDHFLQLFWYCSYNLIKFKGSSTPRVDIIPYLVGWSIKQDLLNLIHKFCGHWGFSLVVITAQKTFEINQTTITPKETNKAYTDCFTRKN